jgi:hypothetical protein
MHIRVCTHYRKVNTMRRIQIRHANTAAIRACAMGTPQPKLRKGEYPVCGMCSSWTKARA